MIFKNTKHRLAFVLSCLMIASVLILSPHKQAQAADATPLPPSACDPEYMDALEARAWLEAQREISQTKSIIAKPDSVLQYTCFGDAAKLLVDANLFSQEAGCCGASGGNDLGGVLESAILNAVKAYLESDFNQNALGGKSTLLPYNSSLGDHTCFSMAAVWDAQKCATFGQEAEGDDTEGFFDFTWYTGNDPRRYANAACPTTTQEEFQRLLPVAFNSDTSEGAISFDSGYTEDESINAYNVRNPDNSAPYEEDDVITFFSQILPFGTIIQDEDGNEISLICADPIPTGVTVVRSGDADSAYPDAVCPNPGCYLAEDGSECLQTPGSTEGEEEPPTPTPTPPSGGGGGGGDDVGGGGGGPPVPMPGP